MLNQKLLFDKIRLEGMMLTCFPEISSLVNDTHLEIQKNQSVYVINEPAEFYFNEVSGREITNADWNLNDEIKNLIPLANDFFIEFTPPLKDEIPFQVGMFFNYIDVPEMLAEFGHTTTNNDREAVLNDLDDKFLENPELGKDYCWWILVSDNMNGNSETGYKMALWELKKDQIKWWVNAMPIFKPDVSTPISAPMICWNIALDSKGTILTTKERGWVITGMPTTELIQGEQINELEIYLRRVVLFPTLFGLTILNDPRTKMYRKSRIDFRNKCQKRYQYKAPDYFKINEEKVTDELKKTFFPEIIS